MEKGVSSADGFMPFLRSIWRGRSRYIAASAVIIPVAAFIIDAVSASAVVHAIRVSDDRHTVSVDTLEAALAAARDMRRDRPKVPIVIALPPGPITLAAPVRFGPADSGRANAPLIVRGAADGSSVLTGATTVAPAKTGRRLRLPLPVRYAFVPYGSGKPAPALPLIFQGDRRLRIATWPDRGYATGWRHGAMGDGVMLSPPKGQPPLRGSPWVEGYFSQDWLFEGVAARAVAGGVAATGIQGGAAAVRDDARLRLVNDAAFLQPGGFVIASDGASAEVMPPAGAERPLEVATAPGLLDFAGASHIRVERLALVKVRHTAVVVRDADDIGFSECLIGHAGQYAIDVQRSRNVTVRHCLLEDTGDAAAFFEGGDRMNLVAGGLAIEDTVVRDAAATVRTASAIMMWGTGNSISRTLFGPLPGPAIALQGNDHHIVDNRIGWAVCEMSDAGAIYMGRDWTQRGIRIERNFIHDLGDPHAKPLVSGVYLDDQFSGATVTANVFLRMAHGVFIGGGRDNRVERNVFAQMRNSAVYVDARGMTWQQSLAGPGGALRQGLGQFPVQQGIWRRRYPEVAGILSDRPGQPVNNRADHNAYIDAQLLWTAPLGLDIPVTNVALPQLDPGQRAALDGDPARALATLLRFTGDGGEWAPLHPGPTGRHPIILTQGCIG